MGTITTDGVFNTPLHEADIVSFHLTLFDGAARATLTKSVNRGAVDIFGNGLTATPTHLIYDFSLHGAAVDFLPHHTCTPIWILEGPGAGGHPCIAIPGAGMIVHTNPDRHAVFMPEEGTRVIGTVVPEPGSLGLMVTGLLSLIGFRKRRS
jgi:hypothetical protein